MRTYRIARLSIDGQNAQRRMMLGAAVIEESDDATVLRIADEPLFVEATLDDLLRTLGLSRDDLVDG